MVEAGSFTINLPVGQYYFTAEKEGFLSTKIFVTVTVGKTTTIDITLTPGSPTPTVPGLIGVWKFYEAFNGINFADCGYIPNPARISIMAWVKPAIVGEGGGNVGIAAKAESGVGWSWQLRYNAPGGYLGFQFNSPEGAKWVSVKQKLLPGEMYHVAGTYDGTTIRCYLNGVLRDTNTLSSIVPTNTRLFIGQDGWGNNFKGIIDEVIIHNYSLIGTDVLRYSQKTPPPATLPTPLTPTPLTPTPLTPTPSIPVPLVPKTPLRKRTPTPPPKPKKVIVKTPRKRTPTPPPKPKRTPTPKPKKSWE